MNKTTKIKKCQGQNWGNEELTDGQIKYATEDATVVYDIIGEILKQYPFCDENDVPEFFQLANKIFRSK